MSVWLAPIFAAASVAPATVPDTNIPPALGKVTECMVETARAAHGVRSAESGVTLQDGEVIVYVRYEYEHDGRIYMANYSRGRDEPLESLQDTPNWKRFVKFTTILSGLAPACDPASHGRRHCESVMRRWERHRPQPTPGAGLDAVSSAWQQTCFVVAMPFWF